MKKVICIITLVIVSFTVALAGPGDGAKKNKQGRFFGFLTQHGVEICTSYHGSKITTFQYRNKDKKRIRKANRRMRKAGRAQVAKSWNW